MKSLILLTILSVCSIVIAGPVIPSSIFTYDSSDDKCLVGVKNNTVRSITNIKGKYYNLTIESPDDGTSFIFTSNDNLTYNHNDTKIVHLPQFYKCKTETPGSGRCGNRTIEWNGLPCTYVYDTTVDKMCSILLSRGPLIPCYDSYVSTLTKKLQANENIVLYSAIANNKFYGLSEPCYVSETMSVTNKCLNFKLSVDTKSLNDEVNAVTN